MSFPRYPEYKDSGVEWLGGVPAHWEVMPIRLAARLESGHTPSRSRPDWWENCTVPWFTLADVWQIREEGREVVFETKEKISELGLANSSARLLPKGTVILSRTASVGFSAIMGTEMATTQDFANWVCGESLIPEFLLYVFRSMSGEFKRLMMGSTHNTIYMPDIQAFRFALPPRLVQERIIGFLRRETAKIDALIEEQKRLIGLLKEKRQAVISQAVTKGLDPKVPMKDSTVRWLGEVPEHWQVVTLRRCASSVETGGTPSSEAPSTDCEGGFVWYTPGDFGESLLLTSSARRVSQKAVESGDVKVFPPGSVLIVGIGATLGKVGIAHSASSANQQINAVVPNARADGHFLAWSLCAKPELMRFLSNASTIGIMNQEKTKDIWVALPPRHDQEKISAYLARETERVDMLVAEAQSAVSLLQERRSALIAAAVTGKIDVRELAPKPEPAAA